MEKANPFLSETVNSCERNAEKVPTLRFTLSLTESSDKSCPEFSFLDLIKSAPADKNKEKTPWEDEEGDEEKLRALAKKFEEKYAPKPRSRKRRLDRVEDLVDVTYGYDETDPFVDDTEAYDELIPADWTTEHGGFYINQGELSFRPASSDESEDDDFKEAKKIKHKSPKKTPKVPKVKKVKDPNEKKEKKKSGDKEKKPKKITSGEKEKDKEKKPKKKHSAGSANVLHQLLSPSSAAKNSTSSAAPSSNTTTPSLSTSSLHATNSTVGITSHPAKPPNSLQQSTQGTVKTEPASASVNCSSGAVGVESALGVQPDSIISSTSNSSLQNGVPSGEGISAEAPEPKLPQCLPPDVESCIMRLKQAANDSADEGKCKFFNSDVNHMLLELETKSRALSSKVRSGIYEFLAFYLPCTKETLLKRAKKLLLTDQAGRLREPMAKLKAAVDRVIPEQVKRFEEEVKRHVEEESQQSGPKLEGENADDHKKELFKSAMELSEDPEKTEEVTTPTDPNASALPEDKTKKSVPKRKFIWSDELRALLCDVVQMKLKLFEMSKTRVTSAEDYLKHFFENEVRPLWPKGWMTSRILFKESKQAHGKHTSVPARVYKKAVTVPKKQGDSGDNADSNMSTVDAKDVPVVPPLMTGIIGTLTNTVPAVAASTITSISVASNNPPTTDKPAEMKPTAVTLAPVLTVNKPVATAASVTKMESTVINRPEQKSQAVSVIAGLNFAEKNTNQITTVKTPPSSESVKSQPLTILDFADIISSEVQTQKLLPSQQTLSPQQQMAALLKKTPPLLKDKPREQTLTHLPSSLAASVMSPIKQSLTMSSPQTLNTMPSPPKIVHSSPVAVHSNIQPGFTTASMVGTIGSAVHNSFIDLTSTIRPQQMPSVSAAPQTILGSISSPRRALDLKSCQAVHPSFPQGLTPQSIAMSLNSTMPTQALHQPQPPNLTLFGSAANLQGKGTTPLTHIGLVPTSLQSAMLHLSRQSQDQAGLVLPQNHFNQVLLGMNPSTNQSMPSLQLPHGALLSNQTVYQDPNQTPTSGAHQSPFLPRFS